MNFPFERNVSYGLGALRTFERDLAVYRKGDNTFSNALRENSKELSWSKLRNEELAPFRLFVDAMRLPDEAQFRIADEGDRVGDVYLFVNARWIGFQITTADPDWNGDGGRTYALECKALTGGRVAWGCGGTLKNGHKGELSSEPQVVSSNGRLEVCASAIKEALKRKLSRKSVADYLIIYARGIAFQTMDEGFEVFVCNILERELRQFKSNHQTSFKRVFAVDCYYEKPTLASWPFKASEGLLGA